MGEVVDRFVSELKWRVDDTQLAKFKSQGTSLLTWGKRLAGITLAGSAALGIFSGVAAKFSAANLKVANASNISTVAFQAWSDVFKRANLDSGMVTKSFGMLSKSIGELKMRGGKGVLADWAKFLDLDAAKLAASTTEEQFITIAEKLQGVESHATATAAGTAIFGESGMKMAGLLRTLDKPIREVVKDLERLNFTTEKNERGAYAFSEAWLNISTAFDTASDEIGGAFGRVMAPVLNGMVEWIKANKELIGQRIDKVFDSIGWAMRQLVWAGGKLSSIVSSLGGLGKIVKVATVAFASFKALKMAETLDAMLNGFALNIPKMGLFGAALNAIKTPLAVIAIGALVLALQDLWVYFHGGKSQIDNWTKKWVKDFEPAVMRMIGATKKLTAAEKEAYAAANKLSDSVDVQKWADTMDTALARQSFLGWVDGVQSGLSAIFGSFDRLDAAIGDAGVAAFNRLSDAANELWAIVMNTTPIGVMADTITLVLGGVLDEFGKMAGAFSHMLDPIQPYFDSMIDWLRGKMEGLFDTLRQVPLLGKMLGLSDTAPIRHSLREAYAPMGGDAPTAALHQAWRPDGLSKRDARRYGLSKGDLAHLSSSKGTAAATATSRGSDTYNYSSPITAPISITVQHSGSGPVDGKAIGREVEAALGRHADKAKRNNSSGIRR